MGVEGSRLQLALTFCLALGLTSVFLATILSAYCVLDWSEVPRKHLAKPPCSGRRRFGEETRETGMKGREQV